MFTILTKPGCTHCISAKTALKIKGLEYKEIVFVVEEDMQQFREAGYQSFPQVFHEEKHIGGNRQLQEYLLANF